LIHFYKSFDWSWCFSWSGSDTEEKTP